MEGRKDPAEPKTLKGLPVKVSSLQPIDVQLHSDNSGAFSEIVVPDFFPPGSVALFATSMDDLPADLDQFCVSGAKEAFLKLTMVDLNVLLYRADGEERDLTDGQDGVYSVPELGALAYCGIEGWMHPLRHIMRHNDLGHPLCGHLRSGSWALDYVHNRLEKCVCTAQIASQRLTLLCRQISTFPNLSSAAAWYKARFDKIKQTVPSFMRPKYFAMVQNAAYKAARDRALEQCSEFVRDGHSFAHALALCSVQMYGLVKSASLDPFKQLPSMAAGLPHFASGWARAWGRDVCISVRVRAFAEGDCV